MKLILENAAAIREEGEWELFWAYSGQWVVRGAVGTWRFVRTLKSGAVIGTVTGVDKVIGLQGYAAAEQMNISRAAWDAMKLRPGAQEAAVRGWIRSMIDAGKPVRLADAGGHFANTVEIPELLNAGYRRIGSFFLPP